MCIRDRAMTATVATTGILEDLDLKDISSTEDLKEKMDTLTDSSKALVEGKMCIRDRKWGLMGY